MSNALDSQPEYVSPPLRTVDDKDDKLEPAAEEDGAAPQREGLPQGYRMRADQHYVDDLDAPSSSQPVRMVPTAEIDGDKAPRHSENRDLLESIRRLGIVHPLIIRRHGARYSVIAGHKRLMAAQVLRLSAVPCLVRELDDAQAVVLAAADNLVVQRPDVKGDRSGLVAGIRQVVQQHLATVRACADLPTNASPWMVRSVCDLIRAHSWRATQLMDALDLVTNASAPQGLNRTVRRTVDDVVDGFSAEARLRSVTLTAEILDDVPAVGVTDHELQAGLSGALLATLPLLEEAVAPAVFMTAYAGGAGSTVIEIVQSAVPVPPMLARHFFDDDTSSIRPGGWSAVVGALAVSALAHRHGGSTAMELNADGGSRMRIRLERRSPAAVSEKP